ncbi:DNA mismatch repair endonuclease MutL [Blattabacterium cuenoti]|uniref:DNA mismatch repair endonuclease MutL n=1 Tax=Blattabacterium cuenoti TaxID=1653831 RepID=UPI00163CF0AE|nr:DNA mismatch repair endonuclease MutL [Blattabacterium cuenoti]
MENSIKVLPKKVINQIAAGEIIDRPSTVVKELLENSIDAQANKIDLFIQDAGKTLIQLFDDGIGMNFLDAKMSIQRYATSKIKNYEDLLNIHTKGFRGEALSSISLVSQLEIQTKTRNSIMGVHLFIEDGKLKKEIPINMLEGTRISVKNIFHKFPARRKFLKSSRIEFLHIVEEFYKIILAHRQITYRFYHNGKMVFFFKKDSLKKRIESLIKGSFKFIYKKKKTFCIKGYVSIPDSSVKKGSQFIFLNKRCVNYLSLHNKIIQSYKGFVKKINTISYCIFIYIRPISINFNIHPLKKEVHIEYESIIGECIHKEIKETLFYQYEINKKNINRYNIFSYKNKNPLLRNDVLKFVKKKNQSINDSINHLYKSFVVIEDDFDHYIFNKIKKTKLEIFQINKKYIIFTFGNDNCMVLVDQHRAHQKILYELLINKKEIPSKNFFLPIKISLLKKDKLFLNEIENNLNYIACRFTICTEYMYLHTFPKNIKTNLLIEVFKHVFKYHLNNDCQRNKRILIDHISSFISIKYGCLLSSSNMIFLIRNLFFCKNPRYNNSGNPIFFIFKNDFFEQIFYK